MAFTRPKAAQIDFDITNITDPLIRLNSGQSGANDKDVGIVVERGDDTNVAIIYDESADQFVLVNTTETGTTSGNVTIASYAGLRADAIVYGSLNDGTTTLTATVAELNTLDGITATATELNYTDGVTSNIQTQLDAKAPAASPTFTGNATFDTNTLYVDGANNRVGVGTTSPAYQVEIENTGANALLVLDRTDGAGCFIEGQATRSAFGSIGATPLALAYNSLAVVTIGAGGAITVNPDGGSPFTFPTADGTSGQTLVTDGAGTLSFTTLNQTISLAGDTGTDTYTTGQTLTFTGGTGLDSVITDNTVTHNIDSTVATLTGTQTLTNKTLTSAQITTDIRLNAQAELEFYDSDSSNYVSFRAPATITSNITWTLPSGDGTADQVLATDGAGTLSWADAGSGGGGSGSSYPNSTFQTVPGTNGNFDLSYNVAQTSQETPFEAGGTDAFGVNLGSVFSLMDPIGSIETAAETGLDLGVLT